MFIIAIKSCADFVTPHFQQLSINCTLLFLSAVLHNPDINLLAQNL